MGEPYEIRYADVDGYDEPILDELLGTGQVVTEDLGGSIMLILYGESYRVHLSIGLTRLPRSQWWDEIREAWYGRRWPCFWEPRQYLVEQEFTKPKPDEFPGSLSGVCWRGPAFEGLPPDPPTREGKPGQVLHRRRGWINERGADDE